MFCFTPGWMLCQSERCKNRLLMFLVSPLTCNSESAHLLPRLAVLPHKEGVSGAAALQETPLVTHTHGGQEQEQEW